MTQKDVGALMTNPITMKDWSENDRNNQHWDFSFLSVNPLNGHIHYVCAAQDHDEAEKRLQRLADTCMRKPVPLEFEHYTDEIHAFVRRAGRRRAFAYLQAA